MGVSLGVILVQVTLLVVTLTWLILMFFAMRIEKRFNEFYLTKKQEGAFEQWADENKTALAVKKWSLATLIIFAVALGLSLVFGRSEQGFSGTTAVIFWLFVFCASIEYVVKIILYKKALREQG